jgi:DHA1 family multidrug resistance protein-like MFS transporter
MVQAAQILSAAIGPLAGGWLADAVGIRRTFLATAGLCAVALLLVMRYYEEAPRATAAARTGPALTDILRLSSVPALLVVLFLVNFVGRSFTPILPDHLRELGVSASRLAFATGLLVSVYSVAAALSAALLGRASRTYSPRALLVVTLLLGALVVLPMARVPSFGWVLTLATLLGLASGGSLTLCYTIGGLMVPPDVKTTAFGFFSGAALFGGAVSPSVAGWLARSELRGIYYVDAALFVLLALALLPSLRKGVESRA